jgi:predicted ATPase
MQRASAAQLFAARAGVVNPQFRLDATNAGDVAELCERLDGLPLAIELIAARAEALAPKQIVRQLEPRLPARQQTLRDAIGWSFDRLTHDEQRVFAHLGVFAGGFTPDAAQAALGDDAFDAPVLEALHHASLLQRHAAPQLSLQADALVSAGILAYQQDDYAKAQTYAIKLSLVVPWAKLEAMA